MTLRWVYRLRLSGEMFGMISTLTSNQFHEIVEASEVPVLVDFYTERCGHCRDLLPELEKVASGRTDSLRVVKFNAAEDPAFAARFRIGTVPNLILFQGGRPVGQRAGFIPQREVEAWIDSIVGRG